MSSRPRRLLAALLLTGLLVGGLPAEVDAAPRVTRNQQTVRSLVNDARSNNRVGALTMNVQFANRATKWANQLARCRCLKHRKPPYGAPAGWYAVAENVGRGWSLAQVQRAFMGSSAHRANILARRYTHIGTGVARAGNGEYFVVQAFMDRTP